MTPGSRTHAPAHRYPMKLSRVCNLAQVVVGLLLPVVYTSGAAAATHNVCASGCPYTTIQAAVDDSKAGDTISLAAGTYFENVTLPGTRLTVEGVGRRRVVIDGSLKGPVFTIGSAQAPFATGDTIIFSEVTIARGQSTNGGAILVWNGSPLVIQHSIVLSNRATQNGGAVYTLANSLTIADSNFINNQAVLSGGAVEMTSEDLTLDISDSVFSHNLAPGGAGGAVDTAAHTTQGTITNSSFTQNQAKYGGALSLLNYIGASLQLTDVTVSGNTATESGGGMLFAARAVLTRTVFTHNVAGRNGGGIVAEDLVYNRTRISVLSLIDSEVIWNKAGGQGGGLFTDTVPTLTDGELANNTPNNCVEQTGQPCP